VLWNFLYLKHFSLSEKFSEVSSWMFIGLHVKYPLNFHFLDRFSNTRRYQMSCISVLWEPSHSMRADGQTYGRTERQACITTLSPSVGGRITPTTTGSILNFLCYPCGWTGRFRTTEGACLLIRCLIIRFIYWNHFFICTVYYAPVPGQCLLPV
jgi:hypothetical protein